MTRRVCPTPGCPNLTAGGPCTACARQRDRDRGTRQDRGYDATHDQLRAAWQRRLDTGEPVLCWRPGCNRRINPTDWHLGHDDHRRHAGPECPPCNLSHAGRAAHTA